MKRISVQHRRIEKKFELEGYDAELIEVAELLATCDPSENSRKKEHLKSGLLQKFRNRAMVSEEELDAVAGGLQREKIHEDNQFGKKVKR